MLASFAGQKAGILLNGINLKSIKLTKCLPEHVLKKYLTPGSYLLEKGAFRNSPS